MSHTTSIKSIKISSIAHLQAAVNALVASGVRCSLIANATPRAYFSNQQGMGKADYVLKLDDSPYDLGLYKQADGSFDIRTDFHAGHINRILGATPSAPEKREQAQLGKLFQEYGIAATIAASREKGLDVQRKQAQDGTVTLVMSGPGL